MSKPRSDEAAFKRFQEKFSKTHGSGAGAMARELDTPYDVISTGSLLLDDALGVGGYVQGRLTEIWGQGGLGKTTLALIGLGEAHQKYPDKRTCFINMEHTFDHAQARRLMGEEAYGRLFLIEPESAEDVADEMKDAIRSGLFSMVVLDSIGAMIPEAEKEKDADEATVALQAKIVTRMLKIATVEAKKTSTAIVLINQVRANVSGYGKATTTGGGFALKHVTTHKLEIKRTATSPYFEKRDGQDAYCGHELAIKVERNKVAPPMRVAEINLFIQDSEKWGPIGIDKAKEAFTLGQRVGGITKSGGWYTVDALGEQVQGEEATLALLRSHPEIIESIRMTAIEGRAHEIVTGDEAEVEVPEDDDAE